MLTPDMNALGIRNYTVGLIVKLSSDEASLVRERTLLNKLNMVLVQVGTGVYFCNSFTLQIKGQQRDPRDSSRLFIFRLCRS